MPGQGRIGYAVAISLMAPSAVVTVDQMAVFETGTQFEPDFGPYLFGPDGRALDPEDHYRELLDEAGFAVLRTLRAKIVHVLQRYRVTVIPKEDLDRPVRGLRAGEEVLVGAPGEPLTVRDAFFFRCM